MENQQQNRLQRHKRPNNAVIMRKFYRDVMQSRILSEVKSRRFREKPISKTKRRIKAIRANYVKKLKRGY